MKKGQKVRFTKSSGLYIGIGEEGTTGRFVTEIPCDRSLITSEGFWGEQTLAFKNDEFEICDED